MVTVNKVRQMSLEFLRTELTMVYFLPIHLSVALLPANHWTFAITLSLKHDGCCHNCSLLHSEKVLKLQLTGAGYIFSLQQKDKERIVWWMRWSLLLRHTTAHKLISDITWKIEFPEETKLSFSRKTSWRTNTWILCVPPYRIPVQSGKIIGFCFAAISRSPIYHRNMLNSFLRFCVLVKDFHLPTIPEFERASSIWLKVVSSCSLTKHGLIVDNHHEAAAY